MQFLRLDELRADVELFDRFVAEIVRRGPDLAEMNLRVAWRDDDLVVSWDRGPGYRSLGQEQVEAEMARACAWSVLSRQGHG